MELEIIAMAAKMLNGDETFTGSVTTGGTESIILAIKAYRDYFKLKNPNSTLI